MENDNSSFSSENSLDIIFSGKLKPILRKSSLNKNEPRLILKN